MSRPGNVTILPPAGREEQLERWGITPDRLGDHSSSSRRGPQAEDAGADLDDDGVLEHELEAHGFLQDGGWRVVEARWGHSRIAPDGGGMTSHRGVLHPDEYVDDATLRAAVEDELGFTYDDVHAVYRRGRLSASTLELRARIDARLLGLATTGANIAQLGRLLGFHVNASGSCEALNNALERARKEHV